MQRYVKERFNKLLNINSNEKQSIVLYPLLGNHHYNLPKGEYYLYFVYAFVPPNTELRHGPVTSPPIPQFFRDIANDSRTFKGYFVSNKVKLVVR